MAIELIAICHRMLVFIRKVTSGDGWRSIRMICLIAIRHQMLVFIRKITFGDA